MGSTRTRVGPDSDRGPRGRVLRSDSAESNSDSDSEDSELDLPSPSTSPSKLGGLPLLITATFPSLQLHLPNFSGLPNFSAQL